MKLVNGLADALPGGSARQPVLMLALGAFALGTDAFVISGVLPKIASDLGVTLPQAGLLITVFSGVYAFAAPVMAVGLVYERPAGASCGRRSEHRSHL